MLMTILQSEVTVGGTMAGWELALLVGVVGGVLVGLTWVVLRAWARRLEARPLEAVLASRIDQVEALSGDLRTLQTQVADLEQRLEFTERLLQRPAEPPSRPAGPSPEGSAGEGAKA